VRAAEKKRAKFEAQDGRSLEESLESLLNAFNQSIDPSSTIRCGDPNKPVLHIFVLVNDRVSFDTPADHFDNHARRAFEATPHGVEECEHRGKIDSSQYYLHYHFVGSFPISASFQKATRFPKMGSREPRFHSQSHLMQLINVLVERINVLFPGCVILHTVNHGTQLQCRDLEVLSTVFNQINLESSTVNYLLSFSEEMNASKPEILPHPTMRTFQVLQKVLTFLNAEIAGEPIYLNMDLPGARDTVHFLRCTHRLDKLTRKSMNNNRGRRSIPPLWLESMRVNHVNIGMSLSMYVCVSMRVCVYNIVTYIYIYTYYCYYCY
jgi:hypothetical protein